MGNEHVASIFSIRNIARKPPLKAKEIGEISSLFHE
jgi:hypothetical protein